MATHGGAVGNDAAQRHDESIPLQRAELQLLLLVGEGAEADPEQALVELGKVGGAGHVGRDALRRYPTPVLGPRV